MRWERCFPDELERAFQQCPVLYLAYGLCEPHGPQNSLGLDALKAHAICCEAARQYGGIVAPPDYWHIHECSGSANWLRHEVGEVKRAWMTSMPPWQHFKNVLYHIRTADHLGFKAAILLTGHYGPNWNDLRQMTDIVQPHIGTRIYSLPDFEANAPGFDGDGAGGDHAGKVETSLLWAVEPDCVDISRIPTPDAEGPHFAMGMNAAEANRKCGERMVQDEARWLGAKAKELLDAYDHLKPQHTLHTFSDVEKLWRDVIRPVVPSFQTMQNVWHENSEVPEDSVWFANWKVPVDVEY